MDTEQQKAFLIKPQSQEESKTKIDAIFNKISSDTEGEFSFVPKQCDEIRKILMSVVGAEGTKASCEIAPDSPAGQLLSSIKEDKPGIKEDKPGSVYYSKDGQIRFRAAGAATSVDDKLLFDGKTLLENQKQVRTYYDLEATNRYLKEQGFPEWDDEKIKTAIRDLYKIKAGGSISCGRYEIPKEKYEKILFRLASYVVMRADMQQLFQSESSESKEFKYEPHNITLYYSCFPNLQKRSQEFHYYAVEDNDIFILREEKKDELKEHFKDVIRLQCRVAGFEKRAADILTPHAFFYGLGQAPTPGTGAVANQQQKDAKFIFLEAALEVVCEDIDPPPTGLILHSAGEEKDGWTMQEMAEQFQEESKNLKIQIPVLIHNQDALAPSRMKLSDEVDQEENVAVANSVMGDQFGLPGNMALYEGGAAKAAEERLCRETAGAMIMLFNAKYNPYVLGNIHNVKHLSGKWVPPEPVSRPLDQEPGDVVSFLRLNAKYNPYVLGNIHNVKHLSGKWVPPEPVSRPLDQEPGDVVSFLRQVAPICLGLSLIVAAYLLLFGAIDVSPLMKYLAIELGTQAADLLAGAGIALMTGMGLLLLAYGWSVLSSGESNKSRRLLQGPVKNLPAAKGQPHSAATLARSPTSKQSPPPPRPTGAPAPPRPERVPGRTTSIRGSRASKRAG